MSEPLFQTASAPYANFATIGTAYEGTILRTGQVQARKYVPKAQRAAGKQGDLEYWPDGKPKMIPILTIQTTQRDPNIEGDDGQRSVWISGKSMTDATKKAVRTAGAQRRGVEIGGWFSIRFVSETPNEDPSLNPTKNYEVSYVLPENNLHRNAADPWADVQPPEDFIVPPGTPVVQNPPVQATSAPVPPAQPAPMPQQPSAPQAPPAAPQPVAAAGGMDLAGFDLSKMTPEAQAALRAMLAQQAGGQQ